MRYQLAPHLHCAVLGDRTVILDLRRDRYQMFGPPIARALTSDEGDPALGTVLLELERRGVVLPGDGGIAFAKISTATRSAAEAARINRAGIGLTTVAFSLLRSVTDLRVRGLSRCLAAIDPSAEHPAEPDLALVATAQAWLRHRTRLPLHHVCLPDSLALHRILRRRGHQAALVIGVRLDPFAAHCWLQAGDMVLNDSCDAVSGYTPILVR